MTASHAPIPEVTFSIPEDAREFYNPHGTSERLEDPELRAFLLEKRINGVRLPNIEEKVCGSKLLAAEMAHALLLDIEDPQTFNWLGLDVNQVFPVLLGTMIYARQMSRSTINAIQDIRQQFGTPPNEKMATGKANRDELVLGNNIVIGSAILSAVTHQGELWIDHEKYYPVYYHKHNKEVAATLQASWEKYFDDEPIDKFLHIARGFGHDNFGARIHKSGLSILATPRQVVSPLVIRTFLQDLEVPDKYVDEVSRDNLALTRTSGPKGMQEHPMFNNQVLKRNGAIPARLGCLSVRHDYLTSIGFEIHQKPQPDERDEIYYAKIWEKAGRYATSDAMLRTALSNLDVGALELGKFASGIGSLSREKIQQTMDNSIYGKATAYDLAKAFLKHHLHFYPSVATEVEEDL